jgi:AcrR family transcriptional regulator
LSKGERRERVLAAARDILGQRGYESASIVDIAAAADITPAVVYDHFSSKAALQIELLELETNRLLTFVAAALQAAGDDLEARLSAGVDAFFRYVEENPYAWRMLFREPPSDPGVAQAYGRLSKLATAAIASFILDGAPASFRRRAGAKQAAEMFAEMLKSAQNGIAVWWYEHPEVKREVVVERLLDFCWRGMALVATTGARGR